MPAQSKSLPTTEELRALSDGFEDQAPADILRWAFDTFGDRVALAMSFGGASGAVILDIAVKINPGLKVYYLDTDFLFPETYAYVEEVKRRYAIEPVGYKSEFTPEQQAGLFGDELWRTDPDLCCDLRKVRPNTHAVEGLDAWISGIRRDQAKTRERVGLVERDANFDLVKINPVAHWSSDDIWRYVLDNKLVYNVLLDLGYKSIGCTHCTRPVGGDADERDGRWAGSDKVECGLHAKRERKTTTLRRPIG